MSFIQNGLRIRPTLPEREVLGGVAAFGIASALGLGGLSVACCGVGGVGFNCCGCCCCCCCCGLTEFGLNGLLGMNGGVVFLIT